MIYLTYMERVVANADKLMAWADQGRSYFWMAQQLGINDRNASTVSKWFLNQGIRRKPATK